MQQIRILKKKQCSISALQEMQTVSLLKAVTLQAQEVKQLTEKHLHFTYKALKSIILLKQSWNFIIK